MGTTKERARSIARDLLPPRLAALGYIKIGGKKPAQTSAKGNDFQPPTKFDHFKLTTRSRGDDGNFVIDDAVHAVVGPKPTELDVRLPFDLPGENFYAQMVHYSSRTRELECDGQTCTKIQTAEEVVCHRKQGKSCPCKPYGRLAVILEAAPTFGGLYVFRTTSWESVNSIQTALGMFADQFGSLRGLPLRMHLYPAEVTYQQGGQSRTGTAYKVALVLRASYDEARVAAVEYHRANQIARREILALASGTSTSLDQLDGEDRADIGGEFFHVDGSGSEPSKLGDMNREIVGGPEDEEDTEAVDGLIGRLRDLQARALAAEIRITPVQESKLGQAIAGRVAQELEASIAWLAEKIPQDPEAGDGTGAQGSLLDGEG